jgi:hypothetical protein
MNNRGFSAYNLARGALLNSKLTLADSGNQPLKLLDIVISGMGMDPAAGLWLSPLHAIPAVPRVFPFDLIYLDKQYRVLDTAEMGPGIEFPAFHPEVASALIVPPDTLRRTNTVLGDHLMVCACDELEALLAVSSLPQNDAAEKAPQPGPATFATADKAPPGFIKLTPQQSFASSAPTAPPSTPFEQSVLTAVAKVAETRSIHEPRPLSASHEIAAPGPSIALTEALLDASRKVQPAVIEHRIDPEDLFSSWVVTAPSTAPAPRSAPSEPPVIPKTASPQESAPEPGRQNGRKSSASTGSSEKVSAETPSPFRATDSPTAKSKLRATAASDKAGGSIRSKSNPSIKGEEPKADEPIQTRTPVPQKPPATTFTTAPYGMWQISMPTGVAPMSGAKSPQRFVKPPAPTRGTDPKLSGGTTPEPAAPEAVKSTPITSAALKAPDSSNQAPVQQPPSRRASDSQQKTESVPPTKQVANAPNPFPRDGASSEVHGPGDFVQSLQEKLQRVQQSRPAPPAQAAHEAPIASAQQSMGSGPARVSSPVPQPVAAEPASVPTKAAVPKTPASPLLKSKPAPPFPASAKPKAESAAGGLRSKFRQWLNPVSSPSDRRRAARRYVPGMVAHYFTGGAPKPKDVADISISGMYLLTDDRWMPGTMIQMTLQKPCAYGEKKQSMNVLSRIVRRGSDGVAIEFIMPEALSHISHDIQPSQATDKVALARFI